MNTTTPNVLAIVSVLDKAVAHLSKSRLIEAAKLAMKHRYNRQLKMKELRRLPEANYPVLKIFPHHHRHMQPCEPHCRLVLELPDPKSSAEKVMTCVDVPTEWANRLPTRKTAA